MTTYLPESYQTRTNRTTEGRARTGEVSPKGLVAHTEHWDGRVAADAAPGPIHWGYSVGGKYFRPLTFRELVEKGYFILGSGPKGQIELDRAN